MGTLPVSVVGGFGTEIADYAVRGFWPQISQVTQFFLGCVGRGVGGEFAWGRDDGRGTLPVAVEGGLAAEITEDAEGE